MNDRLEAACNERGARASPRKANMRPVRSAALLVACLCSQIAVAGIPDGYKLIVIRPPFSLTERVVDLTPVIKKARSEGKPILLYMGAQDCPPCRRYEAFLKEHQSELASVYERLTLVEVRSWIEGPKLVFRTENRRYSVSEFKATLGDTNKGFTWPYWWLISQDLRQIRQLPQGSKHYLDVENHKRLLQLGKP